MKVPANPQKAVLTKDLGQVTRTPSARLKEEDNIRRRAERRDRICNRREAPSQGQEPCESQGNATGTREGRDWAPANAISHWPRLPRGLARPRGCGPWPPPPHSAVGPVSPSGAGAASGSLNPAAVGWGTSLPAGVRHARRDHGSPIGCGLRGAGPGTRGPTECGLETRRTGIEGWGWGREAGPKAGSLSPDPLPSSGSFLNGLLRFQTSSSVFLCKELICVYLLWGWSKLLCWAR